MVNLISQADVKELIDASGDAPCLSIYMPMRREPDQQPKNRIRLKNLLAEAEQALREDENFRPGDVETFLQPATELIEHGRFWGERGDGLAVFMSPSFVQIYSLPLDFQEECHIGDRFYLKPLWPLLANNGRFYILALSQDEVRLLQGTRHTVEQVELRDVPESLAEAMRWEDAESQLLFHQTARPHPAFNTRDAVFHGHGVGQESDHKDNLLRFFHQIDRGLQQILAGEEAPMVLAGVDFLHPIYRDANSYRYLLDKGIMGNPEMWDANELHEKAWQLIGPYFQEAEQAAATQYQEYQANDMASSRLEQVVPAAHFGRVDTLFATLGARRWGQFDQMTGDVTVRNEPEAGDLDLLDDAAVQTFLNGGTVFAVEPQQMPNGAPLAAIFRY